MRNKVEHVLSPGCEKIGIMPHHCTLPGESLVLYLVFRYYCRSLNPGILNRME
jgi:hypothetical protein